MDIHLHMYAVVVIIAKDLEVVMRVVGSGFDLFLNVACSIRFNGKFEVPLR